MKETVLLINFSDKQRLQQVKQALFPLRLRLRTVEPQDYDCPVGLLAEGKTEEGKVPSDPSETAPLCGELLVFAGFSGGTLDRVLAALRKHQLRILYKAMLTASNQNWTVRELHREIQAEHEAMTGGQ